GGTPPPPGDEPLIRLVAAVPEELCDRDGVALGVGVVPAGIAAARMLATERPEAVVFVGTAGAYGPAPEIGTVVVSRRIGLVSGTATLGHGYVPRAPAAVEADPALRAALALPEADVATLVAITTDPALATRLGEQWQVEQMEAFGVAAACAAAGVPFAAVLGITNRVGPTAHAEWKANRDACQRAAVGAVARLVSGR
ncbi:MAG: phosphorylase, partial [Myxococcota bacterium]